MAEDYDEKNVNELQEELRSRDLPTSGSKKELVDRLEEFDRKTENARRAETPISGTSTVASGSSQSQRDDDVPTVRMLPSTPSVPRLTFEGVEGPLVRQPGADNDPLSQNGYVGVNPEYQNYASVQAQPFEFSDEEKEAVARRGGAVRAQTDDSDRVAAGPARGDMGGPVENSDNEEGQTTARR